METVRHWGAGAVLAGAVVAFAPVDAPPVEGATSHALPSASLAWRYEGQNLVSEVASSGPRMTGDEIVDHYEPRTELGRRLIAMRRAYIESGEPLMTADEVSAEVRARRGGAEGV